MIAGLRWTVEERVGPITVAGMMRVNLVSLYGKDLRDAFEYLGLKYLTFPAGFVG